MATPKAKYEITAKDKSKTAIKSARAGIANLSKSVVSMRGAMVGLAGVAGFGLLIKKSVEAADAIGKASDKVGLSTSAYQELAYAANLAGTNQAQFTSNMTAFVKRVGEARSETGPLVSFLKKYDEELLIAIQRSTSQEQAFNLMANAIKNAKTETDRAALANAAFSRAGVGMTIAMKDGAEGLDLVRDKAQQLGIVLEDHTIRQAEKANDQLTMMATVIKNNVIKQVVALSPQIIAIGNAFADALPHITAFIEKISGVEGVGTFTTQLEELNKEAERTFIQLQKAEESGDSILTRYMFGSKEELQQRLDERYQAIAETTAKLSELRNQQSTAAGVTAPGVGAAANDGEERPDVTTERNAAVKKLEILNQSLMDRETRETNAWFRRQAIIDENNELGLISDENHQALTEKLEQQHLNKMLQMKRANMTAEQKFNAMTSRQKVQMTLQTGQQITQGISNQSKTAFKIHKALALANAVVSLPSAVIQSYENGGGYPWGLIPAGLMLYAGIKQIQAIKNTQFGGGGAAPSLAGSGGGGAPVSTTPSQSPIDVGLGAANDSRAPQEIHITIDGVLPTDPDQLDQLADSIADNLRNGGKSPVAA